jgi:hypothetical protein
MLIVEATLTEDMKRLQADREKAELDATRARLRVISLEDAEKRMEETTLALETALQILNESYLSYDEDEDVDFETALERARKMENIERNFDGFAKLWETQRKRVAWENKNAAV